MKMENGTGLLGETLIKAIQDSNLSKEHKRYMEILISNALVLQKENALKALSEISQHVGKMRDEDLKFLPTYSKSLSQGTAVRTGITEYAWVKETMISMSYASGKVNHYMRNFLRLSDAEKERLSKIMEQYSIANDAIKKIDRLADVKIKGKKKYGLKRNKDVKAQEPAKKDKALEKEEEKKENATELAEVTK
jgi:hypothetical protein